MNNSKAHGSIEVTPENLPIVLDALKEQLDDILLLLLYLERSGRFDKIEGFIQMRRKLVETKGWLAWAEGEQEIDYSEREKVEYATNNNTTGSIN